MHSELKINYENEKGKQHDTLFRLVGLNNFHCHVTQSFNEKHYGYEWSNIQSWLITLPLERTMIELTFVRRYMMTISLHGFILLATNRCLSFHSVRKIRVWPVPLVHCVLAHAMVSEHSKFSSLSRMLRYFTLKPFYPQSAWVQSPTQPLFVSSRNASPHEKRSAAWRHK